MRGLSNGRGEQEQPPVATKFRRGPLRVSFRAAPGAPRVHLAVPKSVGTAVVRNRIRRRIRETLRELTRTGAVVLADGEYRLGVFASLERISAAELRLMVAELLRDVRGPAARWPDPVRAGGAAAERPPGRREQEREAPGPEATGLKPLEHVPGRS